MRERDVPPPAQSAEVKAIVLFCEMHGRLKWSTLQHLNPLTKTLIEMQQIFYVHGSVKNCECDRVVISFLCHLSPVSFSFINILW